jgi:hypothetical protein
MAEAQRPMICNLASLIFRVNPPHTLFGNPDFSRHPTERLRYVCLFDVVIYQENPVKSDISFSGHDEHDADSRALYQNWGGEAIKLYFQSNDFSCRYSTV